MAELGKETARCIKEIQTFTAILQEVFISFFDLRSAANGKLKREQLENFVTSLVVRDQVYAFIFNLIQLSQYEAI
jgi:hypothetical protein